MFTRCFPSPGILLQDSLSCVHWLSHPVCSASSLMIHLHVSLFNTRPGISGSFLTKLCLFLPCCFLSLLDHLRLSCRFIPAALQSLHHCSLKYSCLSPRTFLLTQGLCLRCHLLGEISWCPKLPQNLEQYIPQCGGQSF